WPPTPDRCVLRASVSSRVGPPAPTVGGGAVLDTPAWTCTSMAARLSTSMRDCQGMRLHPGRGRGWLAEWADRGRRLGQHLAHDRAELGRIPARLLVLS